jgi:hypothetical protein
MLPFHFGLSKSPVAVIVAADAPVAVAATNAMIDTMFFILFSLFVLCYMM